MKKCCGKDRRAKFTLLDSIFFKPEMEEIHRHTHREWRIQSSNTYPPICRVIHSWREMRSDRNVSKWWNKAAFFSCQLDVFAECRKQHRDDNFTGHNLKGLRLKNPPDHLRGFAFKLSVTNTVTHVRPSVLCQFTHIKRILSWLCVWLDECVYKMIQQERILSASPLRVHVKGTVRRERGCVPTLSTWVRLQIQ